MDADYILKTLTRIRNDDSLSLEERGARAYDYLEGYLEQAEYTFDQQTRTEYMWLNQLPVAERQSDEQCGEVYLEALTTALQEVQS